MRARDEGQLLAPAGDRRFLGKPGTAGNPLRPPAIAAVGAIASGVGAVGSAVGGAIGAVGSAIGVGVTGAAAALNVSVPTLVGGAVQIGGAIYRGVNARRALEAQQRAQLKAQERAMRTAARLNAGQPPSLLPHLGFAERRVPLTANVSDPAAERRVVYGRRRTGGVRVFAHVHDNAQKLIEVVALSEGPVADCAAVYIENRRVLLEEETDPGQRNNATRFWRSYGGSGKYDGAVKVWFHDGSAGQTANSYVTSQAPDWTEDHRLEGIAYAVVERVYDLDLWATSALPVTFELLGRRDIYDPRTGTTGYTDNAALCYAHYLTQNWDGLGLQQSEVDADDLAAAADACDEEVVIETEAAEPTWSGTGTSVSVSSTDGLHSGQRVTVTTTGTLPSPMETETVYRIDIQENPERLAFSDDTTGEPIAVAAGGSGTHKLKPYGLEPRYTVGAVVTVGEPEAIRGAFEAAMAGGAVPSGNAWRVYAGAYVEPTFEITEDLLLGPVSYSHKAGRRARANTVKGACASRAHDYEMTDYPAQTMTAYVDADGARHVADRSFPYVTSAYQAQRLARLELERTRRERGVTLLCDLRALEVAAGSSVLLTIPRLGLDRTPFFVESWELKAAPGSAPAIELDLSETGPEVYAWDPETDETHVTPGAQVQLGKPTAATPVATPAGGTHGSFPVAVTLTCATEGAAIRWKLGSAPVSPEDGTLYTDPVDVSDGETLFARAWRTGWAGSGVMEESFASA